MAAVQRPRMMWADANPSDDSLGGCWDQPSSGLGAWADNTSSTASNRKRSWADMGGSSIDSLRSVRANFTQALDMSSARPAPLRSSAASTTTPCSSPAAPIVILDDDDDVAIDAAAAGQDSRGAALATPASPDLHPGQLKGQKIKGPLREILQQVQDERQNSKIARTGDGQGEGMPQEPLEKPNANDEEWSRRRDKRVEAVDRVKRSQIYQKAWPVDFDSVPAPRSPDPYDRSCVKRHWESQMGLWKGGLDKRAKGFEEPEIFTGDLFG